MEAEILKKLCPKGVTAGVGKEVTRALVDVLTLPSKLKTDV
jgi:hypothetical protein